MVQVEHRCLGAFKEDLFPFGDIVVRRIICISNILAQLVRIAQVFFQDFIVVEAFYAVISLE